MFSKKSHSILALISFGFLSLAYFPQAIADGVYDDSYGKGFFVGGQIIRPYINYDNSSYTLPTTSVSNLGYNLRLYAGYAFDDAISVEIGYFGTKVKFKHIPTGNQQDMLQNEIDIAGKVTVPLNYGFNIFAKAGGAFIFRDKLESRTFFAEKSDNTKFTLLGGLGVGYRFSENYSMDFSVTGSYKNGDLPSMWYCGLGMTYKFSK